MGLYCFLSFFEIVHSSIWKMFSLSIKNHLDDKMLTPTLTLMAIKTLHLKFKNCLSIGWSRAKETIGWGQVKGVKSLNMILAVSLKNISKSCSTRNALKFNLVLNPIGGRLGKWASIFLVTLRSSQFQEAPKHFAIQILLHESFFLWVSETRGKIVVWKCSTFLKCHANHINDCLSPIPKSTILIYRLQKISKLSPFSTHVKERRILTHFIKWP